MTITNNIAEYWKLDENTGTTPTGSVNSLVATMTNSAWATGKINSGVSCDGSGTDRMEVAATSVINNLFTGGGSFSVWIKPTNSNTGNNRIFNKGAGFSGWICNLTGESGGASQLQFQVQRGGGNNGQWVSTNRVIPNGSWSHVVVVYDDGSTSNVPTMYVNGVSVAVTTSTNTGTTYASDASFNLVIGNNNSSNGYNRPFNGVFDEIGLWERSLTASDVAILFNNGNGLQYSFPSQTGSMLMALLL